MAKSCAANLLTIGGLTVLLAALFGGLWALFGNVVIVVMLALVLGLIAVLQATTRITRTSRSRRCNLFTACSISAAPLPAFRSWNITPDLATEVVGLIQERRPG